MACVRIVIYTRPQAVALVAIEQTIVNKQQRYETWNGIVSGTCASISRIDACILGACRLKSPIYKFFESPTIKLVPGGLEQAAAMSN